MKLANVVILALLGVVALLASATSAELSIVSADRTISVQGAITRYTVDAEFSNGGSSKVDSVVFGLESQLQPYHVRANTGSGEVLEVTEQTSEASRLYKVTLKSPLEPGKTASVSIKFTIPHSQTPTPAEITQSQAQRMRFRGLTHIPFPYSVKKQTTTVTTPSATIESYSRLKPVSATGSSIKYGPYADVSPNSAAHVLNVHYESNVPFLTATAVKRAVEVSHWGNIAVEDSVSLKNTGAVLKGSFSRYEFQRTVPAASIIREFTTTLPPTATDIYYRDVIGNVSTSHVREGDAGVTVEITPRFPLLGGWKTAYTLGYNTPTYPFLSSSSSTYRLTFPLFDELYDQLVIDELEVRVVLPETSTNIQVNTPFPMSESRALHFTYLDTVGRPVIVLKANNLVREHLKEFTITYTFHSVSLIQEPLLVVGFVFALFFAFIIFNRIDFSIKRPHEKVN